MRLTNAVVVASAMGLCSSLMIARPLQQSADVACNVTAPNGIKPGVTKSDGRSYGNRLLGVEQLSPQGEIVFRPGGPGFMTRDGALGMKFGWTLGRAGDLKVSGHRLDGDAAPLRASIQTALDLPNFRPSYLIFPTPGCWQVDAQIDDFNDYKLTFITRVVKVGDGPASRLDPR